MSTADTAAAAVGAAAPPTLLECAQSLARAERGLTLSLERTAPLLNPSSLGAGSSGGGGSVPPGVTNRGPLLLPTPRSMDEVRTVLCVARSYSSRTSAPSGWRPALPVFGFATPNPLPHQLRGGALGALQLKLAKEERTEKRRRREAIKAREERERREEMEREKEREKERAESGEGEGEAMDTEEAKEKDAAAAADPKRRELNEMRRHVADDARDDKEAKKLRLDRGVEAARARAQAQRGGAAGAGGRAEVPATMNLSDTSSSEDDNDGDDDDDESSD